MSGPFTTAGDRSRRAVCVELIQALAEKDPISEGVVLEELEVQTGVRCNRANALNAMRSATEWLHDDLRRVPGVEKVPGGWVRLDAVGMMRWTDERDKRMTRQAVRRARGARIADPEKLDGAARLRRDFYLHADQKLAEITQRRTRRLRPLPPAESA